MSHDSQPLVSVVVPAYNAASYIRSTLRSALDQTYRDLEVIVIDDRSKDDTAARVKEIAREDARVRLIELPQNCGAPARPRNIGVRAANGQWIAFLDADDLWQREKLSSQMAALRASGAQFCSSQMIDFTDERELAFTPPGQPAIERIGFLKQLIKFRTPTSSVVATRELLLRHPFNEDLSYKAREDLDCWLHCHEEIGASIKISHPLIGYRVVPGQISGSKWTMMRRHFRVLHAYRFASGRSLGAGALLFTFSHFLLAVYYRLLKKSL